MASADSRTHGEDGIALFYALLVVLVVGGIIVVTFAAALTENRQAAFELDFEDTLHVAEAGAEVALQELNANEHFNNASDPTTFAGTEEEWAIDEAKNSTDVLQVGEGETVWLRPSSGRTEYIYGVGFTPSRAAYIGSVGESFARVVRMQVAFTDPLASGNYAFLSDRILTFSGGGSSSIYGSNGSVHTNGTFHAPTSSNFEFSGTVSFHNCNGGGCSAPGYSETDTVVPLNVGTPENVYSSQTARDYMNAGGDWYDYCGGTWKQRTSAAASPCTGTNVPGGNPPGFTGTSQNSTGAAGVYWFQGATNVQLAKADVRMSIVTGGDINLPGGGATFNWEPAYPKMHAYAGNNVHWGNAKVNTPGIDCAGGLSDAERTTAASIDPGIVYAGNDINFGGNPTAVQIAFLAENDVVFGGGGSQCIVLETDASGDLGGRSLPIVTQWDELN